MNKFHKVSPKSLRGKKNTEFFSPIIFYYSSGQKPHKSSLLREWQQGLIGVETLFVTFNLAFKSWLCPRSENEFSNRVPVPTWHVRNGRSGHEIYTENTGFRPVEKREQQLPSPVQALQVLRVCGITTAGARQNAARSLIFGLQFHDVKSMHIFYFWKAPFLLPKRKGETKSHYATSEGKSDNTKTRGPQRPVLCLIEINVFPPDNSASCSPGVHLVTKWCCQWQRLPNSSIKGLSDPEEFPEAMGLF